LVFEQNAIFFCKKWRISQKIGENRRKLANFAENWRILQKIGEFCRKLAKIAENWRKLQNISTMTPALHLHQKVACAGERTQEGSFDFVYFSSLHAFNVML
jgi:hypothetical protein